VDTIEGLGLWASEERGVSLALISNGVSSLKHMRRAHRFQLWRGGMTSMPTSCSVGAMIRDIRFRSQPFYPSRSTVLEDVEPAGHPPEASELGIRIAGDVRLVVKGGFEPEVLGKLTRIIRTSSYAGRAIWCACLDRSGRDGYAQRV